MVFDPLLFFLLTGSHRELAQQVQFLQSENQILRSKLPRIVNLTEREKQRLIRFGRVLGGAVKHLISVVSYRTFCRWLAGEKKGKKPKNKGRPCKPIDVVELVCRLARENGWGYGRIHGELKKMGITNVAWSTVVKILKDNGLDPGPDRSKGTWADFVQRHVETLWACDFLSVRSWTTAGFVDMFVLFFIHVETRRVIVSGITANPDGHWMKQQARNMAIAWGDEEVAPKYLILDRDTKFTQDFRGMVEEEGIEVVRTCIKAPNMNAYAERWVQSIKTECLDHFVICGEKHLRYLVDKYLDYYNRLRPHQNRGNLTLPVAIEQEEAEEERVLKFPGVEESKQDEPVGEVIRHRLLGGLISHYERVAA